VSSELFEATKRWGRWGEDDDRGALNLLTPERVARAAGLVRDGIRSRVADASRQHPPSTTPTRRCTT
jgi:hypothetical protein